MNICQMAQEEKVFFALDQLHYYAHWITPEARSERFDTRFFLACHPEGQEATYDQKETTVGVWLTPKQALEENLKGNAALSPPTLKTLEDLSRFKNIAEVFNALGKAKIQPILPVLTKIKDETLAHFPMGSRVWNISKRGSSRKSRSRKAFAARRQYHTCYSEERLLDSLIVAGDNFLSNCY